MTLNLYTRPNRGDTYLADLTPYAPDWKRTSRAVGGDLTGSFTAQNLGRADMIDLFTSALGCTLREYYGGQKAWVGMVYEMRLLLDGVEYLLSLSPDWFHNRVKVFYTDDTSTQQIIDWSENTDSSDEYGESNFILSLGSATLDEATALRDRHLAEFAWPRPRMVGGLAFPASQTGGDSLTVTCAGLWSTLAWRYQETSLSDTASNLVDSLVGASEFVGVARLETNSLSASVDCTTPQRLTDLLAAVIARGDASANLWQGGAYGFSFEYLPAPTTVDYVFEAGRLVQPGGAEVLPHLLRPGFLLYNGAVPGATQGSGTSNVWDNPRVAYVDEVEYGLQSGLKLKLYGADEGVATLTAQLGG